MKGAPSLREYETFTKLERAVLRHQLNARIERYNDALAGIDDD